MRLVPVIVGNRLYFGLLVLHLENEMVVWFYLTTERHFYVKMLKIANCCSVIPVLHFRVLGVNFYFRA